MTTSRSVNAHESGSEQALKSDAFLQARDRAAQQHARAARSLERGRARRRFLPAAIVGSALLVTAGLADRFVQASLPRATVAAVSPTTAAPSSANALALAQVSQTLAADQRAIAALAKAQNQLAASAGGDGGGRVAISTISLPTLPTIPNIPTVSAPAATAAPATHATTGASVVVP